MTPWTAARQASLFFSISWSLLKLMSIESVMLSHYPILCLSILLLLENHTTGKTIALTIWTFISKVMSLLFNTLSRSVIAFLPRSKHLLILWLQSPFVVILEPKKIKFVTVSTFSPSIFSHSSSPELQLCFLTPLVILKY